MSDITPFEAAAKMPVRGAGQATMVEQSRAVAEVQAAVVVAQNRPRDRERAMAEMREVCRIQALADRAFFRFNRGGSQVNGETVHLARELARCWGNITCGISELSRDDVKGQSEMLAFAWDLQTNDRQQTTFIVPHLKDTKQGSKPITDMRDIYENNANMGARRLREMIFAVLPVWFKEEAADICRYTLENGGGKPLVQRIADCVAALGEIGVSRAQIERKMSRPIGDLTAEDVASLGIVYKSIRRGEVQKDDEFPREAIAQANGGDSFEAASAGKQPAQTVDAALGSDTIPHMDAPAKKAGKQPATPAPQDEFPGDTIAREQVEGVS